MHRDHFGEQRSRTQERSFYIEVKVGDYTYKDHFTKL
jgi:hypothetical protein